MEDLKRIKIGVLGGGVSEERDISLFSAQAACESLQRSNLDTVFIDIHTSEKEGIKNLISFHKIDLAFIALHGQFGEDGGIQKILEELDVLYTGSPSAASFLAMNKAESKNIFVNKNIPTPDFIICSNKQEVPQSIKYPIVVKPHFSGSSLGISIVKQKGELDQAIDKAFSYKGKLILEEYIEGREMTVGILEENPLAVVEIIPKRGYYDFEAKYDDENTKFAAPAELEPRVYREIQEIGAAAHKALGCRHFSRVDMRLSKTNMPYVLEVNSIPGLTSHSLLPLSAKACGINFEKMILKMVELSLYEKKKTQKV